MNRSDNQIMTKTLSWIVLFITVICMLAGTVHQPVLAQTSNTGPTDPQQLESFVDGLMAAALPTNHVPGAVVVVVKDGQVFFAKGYGVSDVEAQTPVDPQTTLFRPGSVSKLFTWTAVMQLVESGQLSLDEDINVYLDFTIPDTYPEPITLRHLLSHTAGFEDVANGLFKLNPDQVVSLEEYVKSNVPTRVYRPGTIGAYSNYGSALAGYIVQRISGLPFEDYVQQNILQPLSMQHATFKQPLPATLAGDMANGYGFAQGLYKQGEFEIVVASPAGGLSSSGLDMANFMIAHLQDGTFQTNRILEESTVRQMHSLLYTADPRIDGMAYGFFQQTDHGQLTLSHGGDTMLFHSFLRLLPEQNMGIFISTNGTNGGAVVESVITGFMDYYFPQEPENLTPTEDFELRADDYRGSYFMSRSNYTGFEKIVFSLISGVNIVVDEDHNVLVTYGGKTVRYVEVEPNLLVNPANSADRLLMKIIDGQITIHPNTPFVFIKSPWYRNQVLFGLIFIGGLILFLVLMIRWIIGFFRTGKNTQKQPRSLRFFRLFASLFGLILFVFLTTLALIFGDINPAYGVPNIYFGAPAGFDILLSLPVVMFIVSLLMIGTLIVSWIKKDGQVSVRVGYSLLTLVSLSILWALVFWNFLF